MQNPRATAANIGIPWNEWTREIKFIIGLLLEKVKNRQATVPFMKATIILSIYLV